MIGCRSLPGLGFAWTQPRESDPTGAARRQVRRLGGAGLLGGIAGAVLALALIHPVPVPAPVGATPAPPSAAEQAAAAVSRLAGTAGGAAGVFQSDFAPPAPSLVTTTPPVAAATSNPPAPLPAAAPVAVPAPAHVAPPAPAASTTTRVQAAAPSAPAATPEPTPAPTPAPTAAPQSAPAGMVASVVALVNQDRAALGLSPLGYSSALGDAAQIHARQDAVSNTMTHDGLLQDLSTAGVSFHTVGECLGEETPSIDPGYINQLWMQSSEHRSVILTAGYTSVGAGWAESSSGMWYVSLIVAS